MAGIGELGRIEVWVRKEMTTLKLGKGKEDPYDIIIRQRKAAWGNHIGQENDRQENEIRIRIEATATDLT